MAEIVLTADNFESEVLKSEIPVLVDFWASWCAPCRMLAPFVAEVAEKHEGEIKVGKVNVDEQPELAMAFSVSSIPLLLVFRDGKVVKKSVGLISSAEIEELIK